MTTERVASHATATPVRARPGLAGQTTVGRLLVLVVVVALWWMVSLNTDLISTPPATVATLYEGFSEGWIREPLADSAKAIAIGFLIAAAVAISVGALLGLTRHVTAVLDPFITGLFAIPRVILYPVILAAVGVGLEAKVWMAVLSAFFPILMNTIAGVRNTRAALQKLGKSLGMGRVKMIRSIYLPSAMPAVMVGIRIGLSVAFISVIVAELFASTEGLGLLIQSSYALQQFPRMFAVVLLVTGLAFLVNLLLWTAERRVRASVN